MSAKDNGGPAFPVPEHEYSRGLTIGQQEGMTLRDYFAAKAMQGMQAGDYKYRADLANDAYAMADAMLSERAK